VGDLGQADGMSASPEHAARMDRARRRSVFIASPVARNPVRQYTIALLDTMLLLQQLGIKARLQWTIGNSNLPRARNELVAEFLASDCTDMLFIDDDMGWKAKDVVRLLASEQDFIGGVGRKKDQNSDDRAAESWCCRPLSDGTVVQDDLGAIEVRGVGTGFVKISRSVFDRIIGAYPELKRPGLKSMPHAVRDQFYRFFAFQDDEGQQLSEDLALCEMWRGLGGTVWADPTIELVHVGEREFTGTFAVLLEPAP
jgi:hypothetical protein